MSEHQNITRRTAIIVGPIEYDGVIYAGSDDQNLYVLNPDSGDVIDSSSLNSEAVAIFPTLTRILVVTATGLSGFLPVSSP